MFDFIAKTFDTILGYITGSWQTAIRDVLRFINNLFTGLHGYWHTVASNTINAWQVFTRDTLLFIQGMQRFMLSQYAFNVLVKRRLIPNLVTTITLLSRRETRDIAETIRLLRAEIRAGDARQHAYTRSVLLWVLVHVLLFLLRILRIVVSWVSHEGAMMLHYFTHLDEFALLLFWHIVTTLEALAWDAGKRLGTFFLSLIVHHVVRFATLIESIIDAVL